MSASARPRSGKSPSSRRSARSPRRQIFPSVSATAASGNFRSGDPGRLTCQPELGSLYDACALGNGVSNATSRSDPARSAWFAA